MTNKAEQLTKWDIEQIFPEMIKRFVLRGDKPIGQPSGFGVVWKALDRWLDQEVAIKISYHELIPEILLCRDIEGQTVRIFEYFRGKKDCNAYVMEYLASPWHNLAQYITDHKYKDNDLQYYFDCFEIIRSILTGLTHIHGRPYSRQGRYVHADIKPDNIFVLVKPKKYLNTVFRMAAHEELVKIIDLGVTIAQGDRIKGRTYSYWHPKHFEGRAGNDLYSLAIVFVEMLTGEQPDHDSMANKKGIDNLLSGYSSGSTFIDSIVLEFVNRCARAATQPTYTAHKLIEFLDEKLFELPPHYLIYIRACNKLAGGVEISDLADHLFAEFSKLYGWQRKSASRTEYFKVWIAELYDKGLFVRRGKKYFVR